jgi:hypothetical protein
MMIPVLELLASFTQGLIERNISLGEKAIVSFLDLLLDLLQFLSGKLKPNHLFPAIAPIYQRAIFIEWKYKLHTK